jgi:hypothetical protein
MESAGFVGPAWDQVSRCAAVLVACTPDNEYDTGMSPVLMKEIRRWRALTMNRKARVYGIPDECLYGLTKRGRMERTDGTMKELYNIHVLLYEGEDIEEFFNTVFPDDIPDEWSLPDQRKSHGSGSLRKGETITLKKFGTIWMTDPCIYCWGFHGLVEGEAKGLEDVGLLHMEKEDVPMESLLKSVHKQLVIE